MAFSHPSRDPFPTSSASALAPDDAPACPRGSRDAFEEASSELTPPSKAVPSATLGRQHELLSHELTTAFNRVVASDGFILGQEVRDFEARFASYCGTDDCVGVASGTAALTIAFSAAGIGRGDEVILPAHTFIASALGVVHAGATPVFCDVLPGSGLIDPTSADAAVTPRTAAILAVHLYGQVCDMVGVGAVADRHGLAVLEDAAQAHGAARDGRRAGTSGLAGAFSFYPSKNLGAMGDAGAVCTNDPVLAERARRLRDLGRGIKGEHLEAGWNERMDGLQAAILSVKLDHLDGWNAKRREYAAIYRAGLAGTVRLLEEEQAAELVYHLFPIRVSDRDGLAQRLTRQGIASGVHYSPSVADQPPFARADATRVPLAHARAWARDELSLPISPELTLQEIERVIDACVGALSSGATEQEKVPWI